MALLNIKAVGLLDTVWVCISLGTTPQYMCHYNRKAHYVVGVASHQMGPKCLSGHKKNPWKDRHLTPKKASE